LLKGTKQKAHAMQRNFAIVPLAAAAVVLTLTPALAKTKPHHRAPQTYEQPYAYEPAPYQPRFGSDPSFTYSPNYQLDRSLGRCVEDLGYGRYEYCD
jgi:hypothetical protein